MPKFFPYDLLFSSYTTVSVIKLKIHILRDGHFHFCICTLLTNNPKLIALFSTNTTKLVEQTLLEGAY